MGTFVDLLRILVLLSSTILAVGALRALARNLRTRRADAPRPDAGDLAIDGGMLLLGLAGMALAGRSLL